MAECITCGGFVSDDYARVFGNNENEIDSCRSCRAERSTDEDEPESEQPVLLRDVRGTDADLVGRRAGVTGEPDEADVSTPDADTAPDVEAADEEPAPNRFGIESLRSTIRSLAR